MKRLMLLIAFSFSVYAKQTPKSVEFLAISFDPRSIAQGGAGVGQEGGISSIYLNPSLLIGIENEEVVLMHNEWIDDIQYEFIGYGRRIDDRVLGLSGIWLHMPKIEGREPNKELLMYEAYDLGIIFTYAKLTKLGVLGGSIKAIRARIEKEEERSYAFDLGFLKRKPNFAMGASISNFGPKVQFIKEGNKMPLIFRMGCFFKAPNWKGVFDFVKEIEEPFSLRFGGEFPLKEYFLLRCGLYADMESNQGATGGFEVKKNNFSLNYAFISYKDEIGNSHSISLGINF
ncbi:MAG: PorV/PorQ family protein [bacterium]